MTKYILCYSDFYRFSNHFDHEEHPILFDSAIEACIFADEHFPITHYVTEVREVEIEE